MKYNPQINIWNQHLIVSPYCRVSTDKDDQANSLESQIKYYTDFIQNIPNWTLGEIYYDEGITGTSVKKRKNFNRLIDDALAGKVQFIITKEVSRFARNTVDTLVYTRKLKRQGVGVYFALDNINTLDSDGELRLTIMASIAQEESRKTSERVKWGHRRQMEKGVVLGHGLLGYRVKDGKLIIVEEEIDAVKLIFNRYIEGATSTDILKELRVLGIGSMFTPYWNRTSIYRILKNEKYMGDLCQGKTYTVDYLTKEVATTKDIEKMVYIKDHHEAIIDRETWEAVQKELARRSTRKNPNSRYSTASWCSGLIKCDECGKNFIKRTVYRKNGETSTAIWRCNGFANAGIQKILDRPHDSPCGRKEINQKVIDMCVQKSIDYIKLNSSLIINDLIYEIKQIKQIQEKPKVIDVSHLADKIDDIKALKKKAIDLVLKGLISDDDLKEQCKHYDIEIDKLTKQITETTEKNQITVEEHIDVDRYREEIRLIIEADTNNTILYKELIDRIVILKDKYLIIYLKHIPFGIKYKYSTKGKLHKYVITLEEMELVDGSRNIPTPHEMELVNENCQLLAQN